MTHSLLDYERRIQAVIARSEASCAEGPRLLPCDGDTAVNARRRHRKRRALHELLDYHGCPNYRIGVKDGRLTVGPKEAITPEAREFIANNRDDLMAWCLEWEKENQFKEDDEDV